ncbi:MAG: hypothetical protein EXQ94_10580 [Alphaproteobacteria bacterium]|nr:hypothetical protein [Alphaproteobacteria bacterium]
MRADLVERYDLRVPRYTSYPTAPQFHAGIGLGASAIGSLPQGYVQNAVSTGAWGSRIERGNLSVQRGFALLADDRLRRDAIERLMCDLTVDVALVARRHGFPAHALIGDLDALAPMVADGLAVIEGSRVRVTDAGRPFIRVAAAAFDRYLRAGESRHARAV